MYKYAKQFFKSIEEQITETENNPYSNSTYPLLNNEKKPTYTADPFVLRDADGTYYMSCMQTEVYANKEFKTFKAVPVFTSIDLINWTYASDVFSKYKSESESDGQAFGHHQP